jgi:hypothetical protein
MNETTTSTRRNVLQKLGLLAAGVVGAGTAGKVAAETAAAAPSPRLRKQTLVLQGRDWRLQRPGVRPGTLPGAADAAVPLGRFVDSKGRGLGTFRASALSALEGAFHLHTFELTDGTILGIGASKLDEGSYAIVGGTGRYAGASGTYTARQFLREMGGNGTAQFTFDLQAWEA